MSYDICRTCAKPTFRCECKEPPMTREQMKEVADHSWGQDQAPKPPEPHWPDEPLEKQMRFDAGLLLKSGNGHGLPNDCGHHILALLGRVADLERMLKVTGYFQNASLRKESGNPAEKDYFHEWKDAVEYAEAVDALLDGYFVPTRKDGTTLWLRDRVLLLAEKARLRSELAYKLFKVAFEDIQVGLSNGDFPGLKPLWEEAKKEFDIP